jgi:Uma2 family endonuclease
MTWQEICDEPTLQNLPFKVEINEKGQITLSPASNHHGRHQIKIGNILDRQMSEGEVIGECSVDTADGGVRVADVAWLSAEFFSRHGYETPYSKAPDLCVEVTSPSNSRREIEEKTALYLAAGAKEVWICNATGEIRFISPAGPMEKSALFPEFPSQI